MKRWLGLYAVAFFAFLHLPLLTLAFFSFNSSRFTMWEHFSLEWYRAIFRDPQILEGTWNSVVIALWATVLSTVIGTLCAYGLWKRDSRTLTGALYLSLVTPEIVTGISLLALFQWAFRWLHWQLGLYTVVLAHVAFSIAYVVIVVSARLRTVSPALEEAAMDLGANPWQAFWHVTLPALAPGIVAAALLALTVSFDDYVITSMVAGVDSETLPMVIYAMARRGASPVINAISALITLVFGVADPDFRKGARNMKRRYFIAGLAGLAACARDPRPRLNVYNWSAYIAPETIPNFEAEFGVRVRYATYESNEEMLAKVISGNSGWDVVFPTHTRLEPMRANGLLAPLRHEWLPGLTNLDARFRSPAWDAGAAVGRAVHVERHRNRVQPQPAAGAGALGGSVESAPEGPAHHAGRSGGHAGRVPEEARYVVQRHGAGATAPAPSRRPSRRSRCCART